MFRVTTWGESHGSAVGVVVDGCPAGLNLSEEDIQTELDKRRPGQSEISTPRSETDKVEILSGVFEGKTLGTPISMIIYNKDVDPGVYDAIRDLARPGHADLTYHLKYGIRDHRGGGRSSARETVSRVAAGAIAKKLLAMSNIQILGHCKEIAGITVGDVSPDQIKQNVDQNPVRCADPDVAGKMMEAIQAAKGEGDSVGGIVEIICTGIPPGLGEPVFDKLDADLARALMSIGAVKGVEIGAGFASASMRGSEMNDEFTIREGVVRSVTNNAGGILGGISTGDALICRMAVKPTSSIARIQHTVNMQDMQDAEIEIKGRHDPAIPPRIVPVAESMLALVLVDHMIRSGFINPVRLE